MKKIKSTIIYDGECNFCKASVRWLKERDKENRLSFLALQSQEARMLLKSYNEQFAQKNTVYLLSNNEVYTKSEAVLKALKILPRPYSFLSYLRIFPMSIRNWFYDIVAKNRHRL
jgi:predicted DCC family thiol-disulfide oxidoreductase YuxK